jgi:TolB protein
MRKLIMLALLVGAIAALTAAAAMARTHHTNGMIAFTRFDPAADDDFVYTANPNGTHGHKLLTAGAEGPRWSPDGTHIVVFPHDNPNASARIVNADDGSYRDVLNPSPDLFLPCSSGWSPNGKRLACDGFGHTDPGLNGMYTIRSSDGGGLNRITTNSGGEDNPGDYSPDGNRVVFLRFDPTQPDGAQKALFVVKVNGSGLRQITPWGLDLDFYGGSWSPQGNNILFSTKTASLSRSAIFVVHADGSGLRQLPISTCGTSSGCFTPSWSPDGTKIVFSGKIDEPPTGQVDIYTVRPNGTGLRQVTNTSESEGGPPDWGSHPATR